MDNDEIVWIKNPNANIILNPIGTEQAIQLLTTKVEFKLYVFLNFFPNHHESLLDTPSLCKYFNCSEDELNQAYNELIEVGFITQDGEVDCFHDVIEEKT